MAGQPRRGGRGGNRQPPAPMSPPAPRATETQLVDASMPPPSSKSARVLRSHSREPETAPSRRGGLYSSRQRSAGSVSNTSVTQADAHANLSTVDEDATAVAQLSLPPDAAPPQSSIADSDINETPVRKRARARLMNTLLPRLFVAASDLRLHLAAFAEDEEWFVELDSYKKAFDSYQFTYAEGDSYINSAWVVRQVDLPPGSPALYYASGVVAAANVVALLDALYSVEDDAGLVNCLQRLDQIFPAYFFPDRDPAQPRWRAADDLFDLALQIRTQLLASTLRKHGGVDPFSLVANIFFEHGLASSDVQRFAADPATPPPPPKPLAGVDLARDDHAWLRDRYLAHLRDLCAVLADETGASALAELQKRHPFDVFREALTDWAHSCFEEIRHALDERDPTGPASVPSDVDAQLLSQHIVRAPTGSEVRFPDIADIQRLKQMVETTSHPAQGDITDADVLSRRKEFDWGAASDQHRYPQGANGEVLGDVADPFGEPSARGVSEAERFGTKRPAPADDEAEAEGEDDDAFEVDSRVPKRRRTDGSVRQQQQEPRQKQARRSAPEPYFAPGSPGSQVLGGDVPGVGGNGSPSSSYMEPDLYALSQRSRAISSSMRRPQPQSRTPWSYNDSIQLVRAVDAYRCKWSSMEKSIAEGTLPFEHKRNQQALRDKARLLKQDFLKTDANLPPGFDLVILGKKEKEAVIACGKNPDRKEDDLDLNHKPTNTAYLGG